MEQKMKPEDKKIFKITAASGFGTFFEWYDFLLYATATALVFNKLFFPNYSLSANFSAEYYSF